MSTHQRRLRRTGASLYMTVLGVSLVVTTISLTTSVTGRLALRANQANAEMAKAHAAAHSGIEYALNWMNRNDDWRTQLSSGGERTRRTWNARFTWSVTDADGDLADDARDHAVLRSVGREGAAYYAIEVDIEPAGRGLTCLESVVHAGANLTIGSGSATVQGSGILSANNNIEATGSSVQLDCEAAGVITGGAYNGDQTEGVAAREMPGDHVFDWYLEHGTEIDYDDLEGVLFSSDKRLSIKRLSRELNPFGEPNPKGIYWIDCKGQNVRLRWSRLLGTLVLLNAGGSTRVEDALLFQAEAQNYPVLMVQGDLRIDLRGSLTGQELHEGLGVNYNSTGIPYEGVTDEDDDDQYPARLDGIVYVTGTATVTDDSKLLGNLVAGSVVVEDGKTLDADYRPYSYNYPPPGFSAGQGVRVLPGSWRRTGL